jgi:hypothetical protein
MENKLKSVRNLDAVDGTIYGKHNTAQMVNPYKSKFVVYYSNGDVKEGNNLYDTGWDNVHDGIKLLQYRLSTGHLINIPKFRGYFPTIEVSESVEGFKLFHAIHVKCLADDKILKYKIILKQDQISKYKIGDVIVSEETGNCTSPHWKMAG